MVSVSQHPSVHRAAFFLDAVQITPSPAFPGFCVASFLGSGPPFFFFSQSSDDSAYSNCSSSLTLPSNWSFAR